MSQRQQESTQCSE